MDAFRSEELILAAVDSIVSGSSQMSLSPGIVLSKQTNCLIQKSLNLGSLQQINRGSWWTSSGNETLTTNEGGTVIVPGMQLIAIIKTLQCTGMGYQW